MPPRCSICAHPDRTAIETAIASRQAIRAIARHFLVSKDSLARHRDTCGVQSVVDARHAADEPRQRTVRGELERLFERINKLYDACDRWLADPDRPGEYTLTPRAEEVDVVYIDGYTVRKAKLSVLLARIQADTGIVTGNGEWKVADPRDLVLKTATQLTRQIDLLAKLTGELNERPEINILVHPQWVELRQVLLTTLAAHPQALEAVYAALEPHAIVD